jgi:hypothetical protein
MSAESKEQVIQEIMRKIVSPTLGDAVRVLQFESMHSVERLLEIDCFLRRMWSDRRDTDAME